MGSQVSLVMVFGIAVRALMTMRMCVRLNVLLENFHSGKILIAKFALKFDSFSFGNVSFDL
jgi:hypothetical protein